MRLSIGRLSVKTTVTLVATLLFLLSVLLVSAVQLYYVKAEMKTVLGEQQYAFVARVADDLDQKLHVHSDLISANATAVPLRTIENIGALQKWLDERNGLRAVFSNVIVISAKGIVLADTPKEGRQGLDVSDREYFRATVARRKPYISAPFVGKSSQQPVVTFSAPVLDKDGGIVALVTGSLNLLRPNFLGDLAEAKVGQTGSFAVFTRDRAIVVSRDKSRILTPGPSKGASPYFDRATGGAEGWEEAVNSRGLRAIFSYSQLDTVPWVVVASLPVEEAYAPIASTQRRIMEVTLLLALLVAPLVWLAVRRFYDPLSEALGESEQRFRQLSESIREVFWLTDPAKNKILYVSPAYEEIWGRSVASLRDSPRDWLDAIHPEDRQRVIEAALARQARGDYEEQFRIVKPDGSVRWIRDRAFPVKDASGAVFRIAGVAEDITEEKRAGDELRESERRFSEMLGRVQLVSLMLDRDANITYCNDYLLELTAWRREEVQGRNWLELFIPPEETMVKEVFHALIANQPPAWHHENAILTRSGGRRLIRWNNSVLRSAAGEIIGTASIGEDITERKEAEGKIRRLNRVYAVLSGINALIVRAHNREELYREACRIAVEQGEFGMAWIGELDPETSDITPVAWNGMDDAVALRKASARDDVPEGQGTVGRAIRARQPAITNDISADPQASGPRRQEALRKGLQSIISMPLIVHGETKGTLTLFARERNFFNAEELKLLTELAGDISFALDHIEKADRLDYLAYYDPLTGLANRTLFQERLEQKVTKAHGAVRTAAVFLLDVDRFKTINDAFGRPAGDELLKQIADRLVSKGGGPGRFSRVGADHFAVFAPDLENGDQVAEHIKAKLDGCFGPPYRVGGNELRISARAGIAMYPADGADADTLFRNAEAALKKAKASGEKFVFYRQEMTDRIAERLSLESKLRQAIEKDEFVLHYQPKVDLETRAVTGVEALIRWQSPELGLVPPLRFIPLLEETGLILEVGAWALKRASRDHRGWVEQGLPAPRVAVNVSAIQLRQKDFVAIVEQSISEGLSRTGIDLEVTESLIMEDVAGNVAKLKAIRGLGIGLALDDFGTGYSSLAYLTKLPIETLKIDRSFIVTMLKDPDTMTLVRTIITMARSLRLKVVAEGVETEEQAGALRLLQCDQMQGYLFSKPLPNEQLVALLRKLD